MTLNAIIALYVALNMLLAVILMYRVGQVRLGKKINLGDGGDELMLSRIRAHGNFTENAPLALLGLVALAYLGAHPIALHIFGAAFFIGRILHAMGMASVFGQGRLVGTLLTLLTFVGQAIYIFVLIFTSTGG
jgi:uncharacterized membrane protein YecN with MAPEG domain